MQSSLIHPGINKKVQEIETWVQALEHFDNQEYDLALRSFAAIADTSKILFNCGVIYATLGEHEKAVRLRSRRLDSVLTTTG
jgi:hypothetical protein